MPCQAQLDPDMVIWVPGVPRVVHCRPRPSGMQHFSRDIDSLTTNMGIDGKILNF